MCRRRTPIIPVSRWNPDAPCLPRAVEYQVCPAGSFTYSHQYNVVAI